MSDQSQQTAVFKDEQTQRQLNEPLKYSGSSQNKDFLEMLIKLINEGKIQIYKADSLINHAVYDKLEQKAQGQADYEAMNLLHVIREIKGLYEAGYKDTYQIDNLVEKLRVTKERLEAQGGDIFII
ncbi:hypothetical protein HZA40_04470 [Candidatus Peregrinibacteria bacterium]|nr:hypothetical protein [Candidatus Peregrinibacteria bacterium]